ncbi:olfactory receptor 52L1-like [Alligator sinensis]|uniref:Olfactory receptor 52L1-like n=1 Tax=Alligator sinensis TaxID=38654 RepID=A0A1U7SK31_ALLSI|nr:olfactory receptor 52L1-like [Alligator sinensis]
MICRGRLQPLVFLVSPVSILTSRLPFCGHRLISHSYCEHMAVVKLVCGNVRANITYGLFVAFMAFMVVGFDVLVISVSYAMILRTVMRLPSTEARLKAVSTCASHTCVTLAFYIPAPFTFRTHRFGHHIPHHLHIMVANLYLLVPPMLNPIVYGIRTRQIQGRVIRLFQLRGI